MTIAATTVPAAPVKTRAVTDRRTLRFGRMNDLAADIDAADAIVQAGGSVRATGNWTPAMIVDHITRTIKASLDGFQGVKAPMVLRMLGPMMRDGVLNKPIKPGFNAPKGVARLFLPDPDITWDQAVADLRTAVQRSDSGERMQHPSPVFGPLNHEQWTMLHCRHAELHFGFLHAVEPSS